MFGIGGLPTKSVIASLSDVLKRIQKFGQCVGHARGVLLWFRLRQHVRKQQGARHVVQVPGPCTDRVRGGVCGTNLNGCNGRCVPLPCELDAVVTGVLHSMCSTKEM